MGSLSGRLCLVEDVLEKIKELLEDNLTAELTRQDDHADDGIECDEVVSYVIGDEIPPTPGLPVVLIRAEGTEQVLYATKKKDVNYRVSIGVCVTDTDADRSQRKLWRTMRAIENTMEIHAPGASPIIDYKTESMDFHAPLFTVEEQRSTEKAGIIQATFMERLDSYTAAQI